MSTEKTPQLSVLLLTLDQEGKITPLIHEIRALLDRLECSYEIVVIDSGSKDKTLEESQHAGAHCFRQKRFGYGGALREGFLAVQGRYILTLDADGYHPPEIIERLWKSRLSADIVIASQNISGGSTEAPLTKKGLSTIFNLIFRKVLHIPLTDFSSSCRLYRREVLVPDHYVSENLDILPEIVIKAYCEGFSVTEIPLSDHSSSTHATILRFGSAYLKILYRMWVLRNSVESADYDSRAYDSIIPLQRYWQRKRFSIVKGFLSASKNILDIGCGSSKIIQSMPEAVAFDIGMRKLRFLKKTNPKRICASTFALPFKDKSFDQVIHSQVLEHVPYDEIIFRELNRIIHLNGILIVGTPDYGRIWWPIIEYFYGKLLPNAYADEHITHYTRAKLFDVLADHGFRILKYKYICGGELIVKAEKIEELSQERHVCNIN